MKIVGAELDELIGEKRSQLKDAFAAYRSARESVADARTRLSRLTGGDDASGIDREVVRAAEKEIERLESEERDAVTRFNAIGEELAQLHRKKHGDWRFPWGGPRLLP